MKVDASWDAELEEMNSGKKGRPYKYPIGMIAAIGIFRLLSDAAFRVCEGAAQAMLGKETAPHYSVICRRINRLVVHPKVDYLIVKDDRRTL